MPDYIKTSLKLTEWLKGQGITFEPEKHAPAILDDNDDGCKNCDHPSRPTVHTYDFCKSVRNGEDYLAPFFGPGGSDNSLKALRAYCKKKGLKLHQATLRDGLPRWKVGEPHEHIEKNPIGYDKRTCWTTVVASSGAREADGIALRDLLVKLMEETK